MAFAFTDSHVHFWDASLRPYPWLAEAPGIAGAHVPADLLREAGPDAPSGVVFVQADCERHSAAHEVRWAESFSAGAVPVRAIVAFAPMDGGAATDAVLGSLARRPLIRGVRHLIQGETAPGFCLSDAFVAGVRRCGELGLSFDLCVRHWQLADAAELVRRCPGTDFILDHAGKPDLARSILDPWRSDIAAMARCPNVACKLSGLVTEAGSAALDAGRFAPTVGHLLETFGPGRLLFGSDWPVVKLATPYPIWLQMARSLLSHLPPAEQAAIFDGNARRVYRIG
jgi:L-fuconolactonase